MHETTTLLLVTLPNIHRFKINFTRTLSNKPFLTCLLTTPTLPCNLSFIAYLADINVSQGSVATYAAGSLCSPTDNTRPAAGDGAPPL